MGFQIELDLRSHNKMLLEENEQLQAKVAELEEEIERLRADNIAFARNLKGKSATTGATYEHICTQLAAAQEENGRLENQVLARDAELWGRTQEILGLKEQLAAEQLNSKRLRDALQEYIDEHEECQDADDWMAMMCSVEAHHAADEAISQPSDTSALDSFVAEKVKEYQERLADALAALGADSQIEAEAVMLNYKKQVSTLTKQGDLAVEALKSCGVNDGLNGPTQYFDEDLVERAIKESEGKLCAH